KIFLRLGTSMLRKERTMKDALKTLAGVLGLSAFAFAAGMPAADAQFKSPHEKKLAGPAPAPTAPLPPRLMEKLDRGVIAVNKGNGNVFISWRLLGTEPADLPFNLYRATGSAAPVKLNAEPLTKGTCFEDSKVDLTQAVSYTVRAIVGGKEQP